MAEHSTTISESKEGSNIIGHIVYGLGILSFVCVVFFCLPAFEYWYSYLTSEYVGGMGMLPLQVLAFGGIAFLSGAFFFMLTIYVNAWRHKSSKTLLVALFIFTAISFSLAYMFLLVVYFVIIFLILRAIFRVLVK